MVGPIALAGFLLQGAILCLFAVAVRRRNAAAAINAIGSFALAVLPAAVEIAWNVPVDPRLPLWLGVAGFLHSLGMLGLYESRWWWDNLTHTVSAALLAALLYAGVIVALPALAGDDGPPGTAAAVTVVATFAVGVFWELIELVAREVGERFDIEPVLVHYGRRDTAVDLVFDVVGALLVVGFDLRIFVPLVGRFPGVTGAILVAGGWILLVGSALMALVVGLGGSIRS
jgi:hypothetical protein